MEAAAFAAGLGSAWLWAAPADAANQSAPAGAPSGESPPEDEARRGFADLELFGSLLNNIADRSNLSMTYTPVWQNYISPMSRAGVPTKR